MNNAVLADGNQSRHDINGDGQGPGLGQWAGLHQIGHRAAIDILLDNVVESSRLILAGFQNLDEIGMMNPQGQIGLADKPLGVFHLIPVVRLRKHDLERHRDIQNGMPGSIDCPHASLANQLFNLAFAHHLARLQGNLKSLFGSGGKTRRQWPGTARRRFISDRGRWNRLGRRLTGGGGRRWRRRGMSVLAIRTC